MEDLAGLCDEAHLRGVAVNLTLNTLLFDDELDRAVELAGRAWQNGVDALIVADCGLITRLRAALPEARLHFSTQLSLTDEADLRAAAAWGARRVTLARELSLPEIERLCAVARELAVEVEVFAHGALCLSYSGQCLLSSMIGGRSANRGTCAQACRLAYELLDDAGQTLDAEGAHLLSPKDLCLLDELAALDTAGVHSIKIEGRMKSASYVRTVTGVYRSALDRLENGVAQADGAWSKRAHELLDEAFSRGFTTGPFSGVRSGAMMSYDRPNNRGVAIGRIQSRDAGAVTVKLTRPVAAGDSLEVWTRKGRVGLTVPTELDGAGKTVRLALPGGRVDVSAGDRVFRVRSAALAFEQEPFEPRVPLAGTASYRHDEPLTIAFWPSTELVESKAETKPNEPDVAGAIGRRLRERWGIDAPIGSATGPVAEPAKTKAIAPAELKAHIDRLGQTPFRLEALRVELDGDLGLGFSAVHHTRAAALDALESALCAPWKSRAGLRPTTTRTLPQARPEAARVVAIAASGEVAGAALSAGAEAVYVTAEWLPTGERQRAGRVLASAKEPFPAGCIPVLGPAIHDRLGASRERLCAVDPYEPIRPNESVVVNSLGALRIAQERGAHFEVGAGLPLLNAAGLTRLAAEGARRVWLAPELRLSAIEALGVESPVPLGVTVIGAERLMVTEHCILMGEGPCDERCAHCARRRQGRKLRDRKGYAFPLVTDPLGRSHLYNGVALDIVPWIGPLKAAGVSTFAVDATLLTPEETRKAVERVLKALEAAASGAAPLEKAPGTTTGHLFRGPS